MTTNITDTIVKLAAGSKPYIAASDAIIFGSTGADVVKIYDGVAVTTDTSIERVEFSRASSEYTYTATNTGVQVSYNGAIVANVANTQKLAFTDGSAVVATSVDATTSAVTFTLGGTTVTAAGSKFTPANLSKVAGETSTVTPSVPTPVPGSYTITPSATSVNEDSSVTFTVAGLTAETVAKTFNYQISGYSANSQVAVAANIDFTSVTGTVTIPAGAKTASFNLVPINDGVVEGFEGFKVTLLDSTSFNTVATSDAITISDVVLTGKVQPFTINTDNLTGTSGDDTFNANIGIVIDPTTGSASNVNTMQSVDSVSGGAGTADTVNFVFSGTGPVLGNTALVVLPSLSGVEVINGQSLGALKIDASTVSELTNLNITKAGAAGIVTATASATADISVAMKAVGAAVNLAGGKNVTVNLTDVSGTADIVSVGVATDADAAGDVSVNTTGAAYSTSTANTTLSGVNVTGGKTITVTNKAAASTSAAAADTSATTITQGGVNVIGNSSTTAVTIKQDATVAVENAANTTGGVTETASAKFSAMTSGETIILDNLGGSAGLTFTASGALTAAEAATAFANLVNNAAFAAPASIALGDTQGSGSAA
jgi:hypothetical protein